ncbi:MAG: DUF4867 family protein [Bacteroidales bacterium]|nr:DUF4867 family protein [Bacteroidales bacterium]
MEIKKITDPAFRKYGRLVTNVDFAELIEALKTKTPMPEGVGYEPSVPALEATATAKQLQTTGWGEGAIEVGYCNGHNTKLNAVEYHRNSEINVAATDAVLIVGMQQDVTDDFTYDTAKMEAFLLPAGQAAEIYGTTLHYAPCSLSPEGFKVGIVLPKGTNFPLTAAHNAGGEDKLLMAQNKWLIAHKDGGQDPKAFIGLIGENLDIAK